MTRYFLPLLLLVSCATVSHAPPADRGFLTTDDESGTAAELHWPIAELPITVLVSPDMPARDVALVTRIANEYNDAIGTRVFDRPITSGERVQTRVEVADMQPLAPLVYVYTMQFWNGRERTADTRTYYNESGEIEASVIRLPEDPDSANPEEMVRHELGHALGLAHDDQGPSVMSPKVSAASHGARYTFEAKTMSWRYSDGYAHERQTLTAHDTEILRRAYRLN